MIRATEGQTIRILDKTWVPDKYHGIIGKVYQVRMTWVKIRTLDNRSIQIAHGGYAIVKGE